MQPNVPRRSALTRYRARFWLALAITGAGAGIAGGLLMQLLRLVEHFAWSSQADDFLAGVQQASAGRRVLALFCAGLLASAGAVWLRSQVQHGGGITAAIWFRSGRVRPLRTSVSAVLSICLVGLGASLGREGAFKQAGSVIAAQLARWTRLTSAEQRLLVACGAGAGISAAYNVPFGGALFALEVFLGSLNLALVAPALATSFIATLVAWTLIPNETTYRVEGYELTATQIVWSCVAGPVLGFATVGYIRLVAWADRLKPSGWMRGMAPLVVFTALGLLAIPFPELLGNGKDVVQRAIAGDAGFAMLLVVFLLKPLTTAGCLGCGAPGGLFTPTLTCGSALGGLLGLAWERLWPGAPPGSYALLGACAVLAAASQGPLSAIVLTLELTRRLDALMVPQLITLVGATVVAHALESRSIYTARIRQAMLAAAEAAPQIGSTAPKPEAVQVLSSAARYTEVAHALLKLARGGGSVYVVNEKGEPQGEITLESEAQARAGAVPLEAAAAIDFTVPTSQCPRGG